MTRVTLFWGLSWGPSIRGSCYLNSGHYEGKVNSEDFGWDEGGWLGFGSLGGYRA